MTGQGLVGVRVSVDRTNNANNYGFTLTRPGGWYVLLVAFVLKNIHKGYTFTISQLYLLSTNLIVKTVNLLGLLSVLEVA